MKSCESRSIYLNDLYVGQVSKARYRAMWSAVLKDKRNAWNQMRNTLQVAMTMVGWLIISLPLAVFWLALLCLVFDPAGAAQSVRWFQSAQPGAIVGLAQLYAGVLAGLGLNGLVLCCMLGQTFGFENFYSRHIEHQVRRECGGAAVGKLEVPLAVMAQS